SPFGTLEVTGVDDELDSYPNGQGKLTFYWSVWRETDPVWRDIPDNAGNTYSPDFSLFGVGEHVRIRVEAVDRTGVRAKDSCSDPSVDDCVATSCASQSCIQWTTWNFELR